MDFPKCRKCQNRMFVEQISDALVDLTCMYCGRRVYFKKNSPAGKQLLRGSR